MRKWQRPSKLTEMQNPSAHQQRLLTDIRRLLSTLLLRDVADPRLADLTITRVEASGRQMVTVWLYHTGDHDETACIRAMDRMAPHFEHELRRAMPRRRIPKLRFRWDAAFEKSGEVLRMLQQLERDT